MTKPHTKAAPKPAKPAPDAPGTHPPQAYRHVKAWGQCVGSSPDYIRQQQELASQDGAPVDATRKVSTGTWDTYSQITSQTTREKMEQVLARK